MPSQDGVSIDTLTYEATSRSILANDSILAGTSTVYLGRYTDPESGIGFQSSFIAQFNCVEDYGFPEQGVIGDTATSMEIQLFYTSFFGDSLNAMKVNVYPLSKTLEEDKSYYTNLDPSTFYDSNKEPLATKVYAAHDNSISDTVTSYTPHVTIPLPRSLGTWFLQKYYEKDASGNQVGKAYFANSEAFINNICKGYYFKCSQGDGTVLYVRLARINVHFNYYAQSASGKLDSLAAGVAQFAGTQEVLQVNKFDNGNLAPLVNNPNCTYLKTPAGIFTEIELPIDEMNATSDTLNSVKLTLTRYNSNSTATYPYSIPQTLLMVRKQDMYKFFENNKNVDNITSFYTTYDSSLNQYQFSNIARLISYCAKERADGTNKSADWNKVVLIPVVTTKDSNSSVVGFNHDLKITSTRLVGGNDKIILKVVKSRFNNR